ncbi:hypothetical protein JHK87_027913 [Glycine soja]|nr:hypothetical protein JHK87_027913 [Glycine soja]
MLKQLKAAAAAEVLLAEEIPWVTFNIVECLSRLFKTRRWAPVKPEHQPDDEVDCLIGKLPRTLLERLLPFQHDGLRFTLRRDLERQGQGQVVTCSGAYNGIGINEQASVELQGIKGMWSLKSSTDDPFDTFLVVSFISETRILAMNLEDEREETEIEGFCSQVQTLFCQDAVHNQLVQVGFCLITILVFFSS